MFWTRVLGILRLDASAFEDVESDPAATWQAIAIVVLSSAASALGVGGLFNQRPAATFVATTGIALITWTAWAVLTQQIGTRVLPERTTRAPLGELLRTTGFAAAPGLFQVFGVFPRVSVAIVAITTVWTFAAMVVAVQHALDYTHIGRAIVVCLLAVALSFGVTIMLALFTGTTTS
jgi:hypothetical protein